MLPNYVANHALFWSNFMSRITLSWWHISTLKKVVGDTIFFLQGLQVLSGSCFQPSQPAMSYFGRPCRKLNFAKKCQSSIRHNHIIIILKTSDPLVLVNESKYSIQLNAGPCRLGSSNCIEAILNNRKMIHLLHVKLFSI